MLPEEASRSTRLNSQRGRRHEAGEQSEVSDSASQHEKMNSRLPEKSQDHNAIGNS